LLHSFAVPWGGHIESCLAAFACDTPGSHERTSNPGSSGAMPFGYCALHAVPASGFPRSAGM